jgi:nucleoid-associated protein YgaU
VTGQGRRTAADYLRAVAALLALFALVAGVPALLVTLIGNPVPSTWSWRAPLTNDAVLGLIALLAWIFWAQLIVCLIIEIVAELHIAAGRSAEWMSRIPGTFSGQQALARTLVQAVVAVGIGSAAVAASTPMAGVARGDTVPPPDQHQPAPATMRPAAEIPSETPTPRVVKASTTPATTPARTVDVAKGDSLWALAERHLGGGERWRQIAELNQGRTMPDGQRFHPMITLQPGWTLRIPTTRPGRRSDVVTVEPGDTLWALSQEAYGDPEQWPRIFQVNRTQIEDPDLIYPGQDLRIPANGGSHRPATQPHHPPTDHPHPQRTGPGTGPGRPGPTADPEPSPGSAAGSDAADPAPAQGSRESDEPAGDRPATSRDDEPEATLLRALAGAGALLAGGLFVALAARRRNQFRARRSGRTIAATPRDLVDAERAIRSQGSAGGEAARFLDHALRDLATRAHRAGFALPDVVAARLTADSLELATTEPTADPPPPWHRSPDGLRWMLARDVLLDPAEALAPYPALVAIGSDQDGATWLIDLEAAGIVQLQGDDTACTDLARYIAAELATNTWSDHVDVVVAGVAREVLLLNPSRLEITDNLDLDRLTKAARRVREASDITGQDVLAGRVDGRGGDTWMPTILVADTRASSGADPGATRGAVAELADELARRPGRNAVAFVAIGLEPPPEALQISLDSGGRLKTPWTPALTANRLTATEARALGELFASTEECTDEPMPPSPGGNEYDEISDAAGALRSELTEPRGDDRDPRSLLTETNDTYRAAASTTVEDLEALAPAVPATTTERTLAADPELDADLAEWANPEILRPRLRLLGPVEAHARGDRPSDVQRRPAYYTELIAYLFARPQGVTPQQMAEVFNIQTNTLHSRIGTLRKWLDTDHATGVWHLPESTLSEASKIRGVPIYQLTGLLCDVDLFKRLRLRGQAHGQDGITDLAKALELVVGPPFDQLRPGGYGWLAETPHDHYLTAAIVDVAHIVATHALAVGEHQLAMWVAERAILAAPSDDKPRLDLAKAESAMGHTNEADRYVKDEILNRSDDSGPPPPPTTRTRDILRLSPRNRP